VKYWEIITDNLSRAGFSWGCVSAIDSNGRTIWIADAHRDDGKRFVMGANESLTAFMELESAICAQGFRLQPPNPNCSRGLRRAGQGRGAGVGRGLGVGVSLGVGVGTGVPHGTTETCTVS
jgi:hypothetical protein